MSLFCASAASQPAAVRQAAFEGQPALELDSGALELTVLLRGASIAAMRLCDDPTRLNPLWEPARMQRELGQPARAGGGTGHFVCVDGFGPVSPEERAAGLAGHGEAHRQQFEVVFSGRRNGAAVLTLRAALPAVQEVFTRTFRIADGGNVVWVESRLENLLAFDRPVNWAEHATAGSPFLEPGVTVVDVSASRAQTRPYTEPSARQVRRRLASGADFTWPLAPGLDGKPVDLRVTPAELGTLDHATVLIDPARRLGWVTALHPGKRLIAGYLFRREEYPWLQFWGSFPSTGKLARGLEFGTQPYDVPRREAIGMGTLFGTPTYRWLPAKAAIESRFLMFYARLPEGFRETGDVRLEAGKLVVENRGAKLRVELPASGEL